MNRGQALFFAVFGVLLLLGISFSISLRSPLLTLAFTIASVLVIGLGFMQKARARRQQNGDR